MRCIAILTFMSCVPKAFPYLTKSALPFFCDALKDPTVPAETRMDAAKAIANLVVYHPASRSPCIKLGMTEAVGILLKILHEEEDKIVIGKILRDLSKDRDGILQMLTEGGMTSLLRLAKLEDAHMKHDVSTALANLASCQFVTNIIQEGAIEAAFWLTLQDCLMLNTPIYRETAVAVRYLAQHPKLGVDVALQEKLLKVLTVLAFYPDSEIQMHCAVIFYYILGHQNAQKSLIRNGAADIIVKLALSGNDEVYDACSAALHQLPNEALSNMDANTLKVGLSVRTTSGTKLMHAATQVLMALLKIEELVFADPDGYNPNRDLQAKENWQMKPPVFLVIPFSPFKINPRSDMHTLALKQLDYYLIPSSWPSEIVEVKKSTFLPVRQEGVSKAPDTVSRSDWRD